MPVSKKRKKEEKRRRRGREAAPAEQPGAPVEPSGSSGLLGSMRGGFQNLAGAGAKKKKEPLLWTILSWALVAVAAYFVAKRFGILR